MVRPGIHDNSRLFHHFSRHRLFQAFTRLHETGQSGVDGPRQSGMAGKEAARRLAVTGWPLHQHDHCRIGARIRLGAALRACTAADVTGLDTLRGAAADATMKVTTVPGEHAAGVRHYCRLAHGHRLANAAQILKCASAGYGRCPVLVQRRYVDGEYRTDHLVHAEEDPVERSRDQRRDLRRLEGGQFAQTDGHARTIAIGLVDQIPVAPDRYDTS